MGGGNETGEMNADKDARYLPLSCVGGHTHTPASIEKKQTFSQTHARTHTEMYNHTHACTNTHSSTRVLAHSARL